MRQYTEPCFRNLQDRMLVFGFEGWDIFFVLGIALSLQALNMNGFVIWTATGCVGGFLLFIKRGKPAQATEHYIQWLFKEKRYTAITQAIGQSIRGRSVQVPLNSLQELLPYCHFQDGFLMMKDDSLSKGYELACPTLDNLSGEELIAHSKSIEILLNTLSDQATYQIFFTMDSDYDYEIKTHKNIKSSNALIKSMHAQRVEQLDTLSKGKKLRRRRCYLFVNYAPKQIKNNRLLNFSSLNKTKDAFKKKDCQHKKEFLLLLQSIEDGLSGAGLKIKTIDEQQMMRIVYQYLNPDRVKQDMDCPKRKPNEILARQVCCSDMSIDEEQGEYIQFGGFYHKYVSLKVLPESSEPLMLSCIENLSFSDFDIAINFHAPTKEWGRNKIESMRKREYGNINGMFGIVNKDAETKVSQYESLLEEIQQSNQKLFRMQLTIHVYAKDYEQVKKRTVEVMRVFSAMHGCEMHDERWGSVKPMFLSMLPAWGKESSRLLLLKSLHLADFLPLFSEFRGSGKAECLFFNTTHGLASYDPFSEDLSAFNVVVVGASGSGKSFTINQIVNQYSKNDPIEIFIDIGGSYKRQVLLKDGEYIHLGLKEKFTINLFDLSQGKKLKDFSEEEQNEILIIKTKTIEQMMGGIARFNESDQIVEDYIFRSIQLLYRTVDYPVLSDLKEALRHVAQSQKQYQKFYESVVGLLGNWFEGGQFGKYTDGKSSISLDKSVICFDLKGLEQFERLQSVMLTIVTNFVWGKIMSEPSRRKFVIFDECWKLLATPESAKFIAECYRTFRKYGAGAISITQSLGDFLGGGLEDAILGNSNTRFILRQNSVPTINRIVGYFNFNEQERHLIETLQIKKGEYSEVFFSQSKELKHVSAKMVIAPTPMEYWVATTDAMDLNFYNKVKSEHPSLKMHEALAKCAQEYPNGLAYQEK